MKFTDGLIVGFSLGLLITLIIIFVAENKRIKYCPECGTHYKEEVMYCSFDGTELKMRNKGE